MEKNMEQEKIAFIADNTYLAPVSSATDTLQKILSLHENLSYPTNNVDISVTYDFILSGKNPIDERKMYEFIRIFRSTAQFSESTVETIIKFLWTNSLLFTIDSCLDGLCKQCRPTVSLALAVTALEVSVGLPTMQRSFEQPNKKCQWHTLAGPSKDLDATNLIKTCLRLSLSQPCHQDNCTKPAQAIALFLANEDEPNEPDTEPVFFCQEHFPLARTMCPPGGFSNEKGSTMCDASSDI